MKYKAVERPERTVIVRNKNTDTEYVYFTESVQYSSELKASRPKRVAIGKLNADGDLIPNKNYERIFGKLVLEEPSSRADLVSVGPQFIVSKIIENNELKSILDSIFEKDANKILDVATYMMMSENNIMQYFENYGYNHTLFNEKNFTDNTISNLLNRLKIKDIDTFIKAWVNVNQRKDIYIAYDSTNMNSVASGIELKEYGHAKDNSDLPQINMSLGYSQNDQVPLFYELYPGSIIDNTECQKMVDRARHYGCEDVGFILDRGYFSKSNIRYFEDNHFNYIIMAKSNANFIKEIIEEYGPRLKFSDSHYLENTSLYGITSVVELFGTGKKQYVHLYYNGVQAEHDKLMLQERWNKMDQSLEEKKAKKLKRKEDLRRYEKFYKLKFDEYGYFLNYHRKESEFKKLMNQVGFFSIITSQDMSAIEALNAYRDRDAIEKIFRMEKSYLGNDVFRVHTNERLESKVFVSFIGLVIRNEIYQKMKPLYQKNRKEYTVPKVLRELDRLSITKMSDEKYHIRYQLTKTQKKILKAFDATEKEYMAFAEQVKIPLES